MSIITDIKDQLNDITIFKYISSAFTEASAVKLKNIRAQYERNAQFYEEITGLYHLVEMSAKEMKIVPKKVTQVKALSVALSSNMRFFGNLNIELMKLFLSQTQQTDCDLLVIGTTGINYLKASKLSRQYKTMVFAKDNPDRTEVHSFLSEISSYDRVLVYYPKFVSFVVQKVGIIDITQRSVPAGDKKEVIHILYEPELPKILEFFETQVRLLLFTRVLLETDLARTAARLLTMSQAEEHSDHEIKDVKIHLAKVVKSFLNAQLLDTFASMRSWKHG